MIDIRHIITVPQQFSGSEAFEVTVPNLEGFHSNMCNGSSRKIFKTKTLRGYTFTSSNSGLSKFVVDVQKIFVQIWFSHFQIISEFPFPALTFMSNLRPDWVIRKIVCKFLNSSGVIP